MLLKKDTPNFSQWFILPAAGSALHIVEAIEGRRQKCIVLGPAKIKVDNCLETIAPYVHIGSEKKLCKYQLLIPRQLFNPVNTRSYAMATVETLFNPAKFTEELTSRLRDYKLLGIDVDAAVASQRKNVEALANASRAAFEGTQAVARRLGDTSIRKGGEMHLFTLGNTYRAAEKLFGTHGEAAELEAAHLAEQHFSNIDLGGYARWKAVERVLTLRAA